MRSQAKQKSTSNVRCQMSAVAGSGATVPGKLSVVRRPSSGWPRRIYLAYQQFFRVKQRCMMQNKRQLWGNRRLAGTSLPQTRVERIFLPFFFSGFCRARVRRVPEPATAFAESARS